MDDGGTADSTEPGSPEMRLSDADRDGAVARLSQAMSDGRLDVAEFESRSRQAYAATVPSELTPLFVDLPPTNLPVPTAESAVPAVEAQIPTSVPATRQSRRWLLSLFGDNKRSGRWEPGEQTVGVTFFGDTKLDVRELERDSVDILAFSVFGDVTIVVPPDAQVDAGGFAVFGDFSDRIEPGAGSSAMRVRVRRFSLSGDLRLRSS